MKLDTHRKEAMISVYSISTAKAVSSRTQPVCDWICENPACRKNAQVTQCAFLVPQVENCQSPVFVMFMSKNLSTNLCHHLQRVNVSNQGKISLCFDLPSLYSRHTRSPLLRALIRIAMRGLSRHS